MRRTFVKHFHTRTIPRTLRMFTVCLVIVSGFTLQASSQIVTILKGESCSDEKVLNATDMPLLPARCESAGICASGNPFAGISIIIASQFTCDSTPVDNFVFSSAKVGAGITANAVAQSIFFSRTVGTGFGSADCVTGLNGPTLINHPEGCSPPPPPPPSGGGVCGGAAGQTDFTANQDDPTSCDPIILDLKGNGFQLTNAARGVRFDIHANGHPFQIPWTPGGSDTAFLVLDRNGNGVIDDGSELFSNVSPQPLSNGPNGFKALGQYDLPENGGNADGVIDSRDAVYSKLRLWIDENHDGISQPGELHTLPELGVFSLNLNYRESGRTDEFGNVFQFRAKVNANDRNDQTNVGPLAWDVFLTTK